MTPHPVLDTALEALGLGLSVVAVHAIGEPVWEHADGAWRQATDRKTGQPAVHGPKRPVGEWKLHAVTPHTPLSIGKQLAHAEHGGARGLALVCGYGAVECLEFDDVEAWELFQEKVALVPDVAAVARKVAQGYMERSPRGAPHLLYRCEDLSGGGVLARRPEIVADADGSAKRLKVLIEVRGPGHLVMIAPSPGTCHPTGRPYELVRGGLASIETITPAERTLLHDYCRSFDEVPPEEPEPPPAASRRPEATRARRSPVAGEKPGEHYNRVCTVDMWRQMLASPPLCWEYVGSVGSRPHCWVRPQATKSLSAHLTPSNSLVVFSTSTPLAAWSAGKRTTHSPFHVYALVCHRGNWADAARALRAVGYGYRELQPGRGGH